MILKENVMRVQISIADKNEEPLSVAGSCFTTDRGERVGGLLSGWRRLFFTSVGIFILRKLAWEKQDLMSSYTGSKADLFWVDSYQAGGTHIQLGLWGDVALHRGIDNLSVPWIYSGRRRKLLKRFLEAGHGLVGGRKLLRLFVLLLLHVLGRAGLWDILKVLIWSMRASGGKLRHHRVISF